MEFKQILEMYKSALGKGDVQAIADKANVSKQTVYNMLKREYMYEFKEAEERAYRAMVVLMNNKKKQAERKEKEAIRKTMELWNC